MTALLPVRRGGVVVGHATVDAALFADLSRFQWRVDLRGYVTRSATIDGREYTVCLHRAVLGLVPGDGRMGDHINGDKLDNRRANLRPVTNRQNQQNRRGAASRNQSGFRGVCFNKKSGRFRAYCSSDYLGEFKTAQEAAERAAVERKARGYLEGAA